MKFVTGFLVLAAALLTNTTPAQAAALTLGAPSAFAGYSSCTVSWYRPFWTVTAELNCDGNLISSTTFFGPLRGNDSLEIAEQVNGILSQENFTMVPVQIGLDRVTQTWVRQTQ